MQDQTRAQVRQHWLTGQLPSEPLTLEPASADASFRSYWRVHSTSASWILMDAPPDKEAIGPFIAIAKQLRQAGLHAPEIHAQDAQLGLILLEDLGTCTYAQALSGEDIETLYQDALDALGTLQCLEHDHLPAYSLSLINDELDLFRDWLLRRHLQHPLDDEFAKQWQRLKTYLSDNMMAQPQVFVHRDYHCRNLMVCPQHNPGVIDFQDAVSGPITYDLVSLLRDCYITWPPERVEAWGRQAYHRALSDGHIDVGLPTWWRWLDLTGIQRHLKVAGIFCRLYHRDGKSAYLAELPRTVKHMLRVAPRYPELSWLHQLLTKLRDRLDQRP